MSPRGKKMALVASACAVAMSFSACGGSSNSSSSPQAGDPNAMIRVFSAEPQSPLIPGDTNEVGGSKPGNLMFSQLVAFDPDGKAVNEVAESIKPNADNTAYTIKIKPGWTFTDGTPVTSRSFTRAWSYVANSANAMKDSSSFATIKGYKELQGAGHKGDEQLEGLKVTDDRTFTVDLNQPDSTFAIKVGYLAYAPLPESFYKDPKGFGEHPVGNGQYKFKSWEHNKSIQVVKNPDYKGQFKPRNGGVEFVVYTSGDSAYADVQAGNLDLVENVPTSASKTFTTDSSVQSYNKPGAVIEKFTIPAGLEHFRTDQEEGRLRRQAISMAIDRESICKKVINGTATPAADFTSPRIPGFTKDLKNEGNVQFNPKKAKELWAKADAISPWPADHKFSFTYNADGDHGPIYKAVANMVKTNLGIDAQDTPIPTFQELRQNAVGRKIQGAFRTGWAPSYPSPEDYLTPNFASVSAEGKGSNDGDYKNPEFDDLLDKAAEASSAKDANALYAQAQGLLLRDLPSIPLHNRNANAVASKQVKSFRISWQNIPVYWQVTK
ncbi:oligopeptide-binding protein OppA [Bifidobacterium actinocoloniiforme DSM 22766]|uniref:Oligopeptide-binding protein OppA n=1 Tax=Bifidobacterium actinocoloniiforme DSM 22766 TaxID=1437605 RepID=A0A086Z0W6_9BIFI|nr:ABC transporter substrate-binding protein [Bifidobacterium actinocoloniiforme]AKV55355.1 ABC transporter substrate-binding protein [Bifidobacterium actinocoloniiforme DSM 22766]KFI40166.1 oligopeptide-binding protein OppA [Bifidobacterium actinocoloniiforme DSM 22766]